jgi:hypothetical protein
MSTQENTLKNDELNLPSATVVNAYQDVFVPPGQYRYFPVETGRNYNVVVTSTDDTCDIDICAKDDSDTVWKTITIQPNRRETIQVNGASGQITVYNSTVLLAPRRSGAFVSVYSSEK